MNDVWLLRETIFETLETTWNELKTLLQIEVKCHVNVVLVAFDGGEKISR